MLRVAAINFLNPAPLMWDFEHPPLAATLLQRYSLHYTQPSLCADELLSGRADLGLIPIASLTPDLAIVPGCTIASLDHVRSILLLIKQPHTLETVRTIAADTASRSSLAYAKILFRKFCGNHPTFLPSPADPIAMLQQADARHPHRRPSTARARVSAKPSNEPQAPAPGSTSPTNGAHAPTSPGSPPSGLSAPKPSHPTASRPPASLLTSKPPATTVSPTSTRSSKSGPPHPPPARNHPSLPDRKHPLHPRPGLHPHHSALPPIRR